MLGGPSGTDSDEVCFLVHGGWIAEILMWLVCLSV
jgi:hypothetical protein